MSNGNSDKSVLGGVFVLIGFAIYVLGVIHTANNFSKDKALSAFLIPPYGFYMGVKSIFNPNSNSKDQFPEDTDSSTNLTPAETSAQNTIREAFKDGPPNSKNVYNNNQVGTGYSPKTRLQLMEEMVVNMNQGLPRTENGIRIDHISVINDYTWGYDATVLNIPRYTDELQKNSHMLKQQLITYICSDSQSLKAAQSGESAVINYYAVDSSLLISIEITPADCGF
ncbi:hypothetical protein [Acinetobacter guillouiae]|uniref:hypothetical protein n=1 Tax=Acinetobacter guillouiae TaxID=106649 RepID=UPI002FD9D275